MLWYKVGWTVNEEFNQYDDLFKLFLNTHSQYHSKLEDYQQIEDGNWFDKVDQNIFTKKAWKKAGFKNNSPRAILVQT